MSNRTVTLKLPWPPSANNSKMPANGRMISTVPLRRYHSVAVTIIRYGKHDTMRPPYEVTLDFREPDHRRRDLSNFEKAPVDSLVKAGLIVDDCKIDRMILQRGEIIKGGVVWVTVTEI